MIFCMENIDERTFMFNIEDLKYKVELKLNWIKLLYYLLIEAHYTSDSALNMYLPQLVKVPFEMSLFKGSFDNYFQTNHIITAAIT